MMSGSSSAAIQSSGFKPYDADWSDPTDLAKCAHWLYGMRDLKKELERRTARNIAFFEGKVHHEWSWKQRSMVLPDWKRDRLNLSDNFCKMLITKRIAKMNRMDPAWSVPAYTADEYDQVVSRFSNDVMKWYWSEGLRMPEHVRMYLLWRAVSPICFMHPHWDPMKGDPVMLTPEDMARPIPPTATPEQAAAMQAEDMERFASLKGYDENQGMAVQYTGDLGYTTTTIFNTMWYPFFAEEWDQVHIVLKSDVMPVEDVVRRYGIPKDVVLRHANAPQEHNRYAEAMGRWRSPFVESPDQYQVVERGVLVHQLFIDAKLHPPFGASAIIIGGSKEAALWGKLGNKYAQLPFRPGVETRTPGVLWGTCPMDDLISPQLEATLGLNQEFEWRNQMIRNKVVRIKNDGADDLAYRADNPEAVIEVNTKEHTPTTLSLAPSAVTFENKAAMAFALRFMQDSASVPDISLGRTDDSDVKSGVAVRSIQQEAQEVLKIPGEALNDDMAWVGNFLLAELQDKAVYKRVTPLVGENNSVEYLAWSRAMLRPTIYAELTHQTAVVRVTNYTNIPSNPIEMRNTFIALAEMGWLMPGKHDHVAAKIFGMDDIKTTLDKGRADRDKQEREIQLWRAGKFQGAPSITDDHAIHEEVLASWVKSDEFDRIRLTNPLLAADILSHYDLHQQSKFNDVARIQARTILANMQVGAEFFQKTMAAGVPEWAQVFLAMSMGGLGAGGTQETGAPGGQEEQGGPGGRPDQQRAAGGGQGPMTGKPGERLDGGGQSGMQQEYAKTGDAAGFRRAPGPGKDGAGSNTASLGDNRGSSRG